MHRLNQAILIGSTCIASWLGMQAIHELGHVLGALLTGGQVERVVLHPFTISRTDLAVKPHPLTVVWAGPLFGTAAPLLLWSIAAASGQPITFLLRFFAGFCLLANGLYIGLGSFAAIGDCREMLRHGSPLWHLWLFGALTAPFGLYLWHTQASHFGLGPHKRPIDPLFAYSTLAICTAFIVAGLLLSR